METLRVGGHTESGPLRSVLLKRPATAWRDQERVDSGWRELGYTGRPDFARAVDEYDRFEALLKEAGADVVHLPEAKGTNLDSIYVRDAVVMTDRGVILCNMGKAARRGEPEAAGRFLQAQGVTVLGAIEGDGRLEGGDLIWLDSGTLAVGQGYRTNAEGIRQLAALTRDFVSELIVVPLPHWEGPDDVMHLMSLVSPVDRDLAVVYSRLLPVPFRRWLQSSGREFVEAPDDEFASMGTNVLATGPRQCLVLSGNPETRRRLEAAGAEVRVYEGAEISCKGAGGPTCLTRPLWRAA